MGGSPSNVSSSPRQKPAFVPVEMPEMRLSTYDWVVVNTSAGKDSQTLLRQVVLKAINEDYPLDRVVPVHCDLGPRVEWDGTRELAEEQCRHYGLELVVVSRPPGRPARRGQAAGRDHLVEGPPGGGGGTVG